MVGCQPRRCADNKTRLHKSRVDKYYKLQSIRLETQDWNAREHGLQWDNLSPDEISRQETTLKSVIADINGMVKQGFSDETIQQSIFETWARVLDSSVIAKARHSH